MHMSTKLQTHQCPVKVIIFQSNSNIMTDLLTQTDMWWTDLILRVGYGIFNSRYDDLETLDWFHDSLIKNELIFLVDCSSNQSFRYWMLCLFYLFSSYHTRTEHFYAHEYSQTLKIEKCSKKSCRKLWTLLIQHNSWITLHQIVKYNSQQQQVFRSMIELFGSWFNGINWTRAF